MPGSPRPIRSRYGDSDFGRGCLLATRLVERGVRMVQLYFGNGQPWDNHDDIMIHQKLAHQVDGPVAALLDDLKARGLVPRYARHLWRRVRTYAGGGNQFAGEGAERPGSQSVRVLAVAGGRGSERRHDLRRYR